MKESKKAWLNSENNMGVYEMMKAKRSLMMTANFTFLQFHITESILKIYKGNIQNIFSKL